MFFASISPSFSDNDNGNLAVCPDCVMQAVKVASSVFAGRLDRRITCTHERYAAATGISLDSTSSIHMLKHAVNSMVDRLQRVADEATYVAHETAVKGKLGVQARCDRDMTGVWRDFMLNLNSMTRSHLEQVRDIADVSTAIARGDLSKAMTVPVKGETLLLKNTFNTMGNAKVGSFLFGSYSPPPPYYFSESAQFVCIRSITGRS